MWMFLLNLFCLLFYLFLSCSLFFILYYFRILPNKVPFRYKTNPLDFVLDLIKMFSSDLQNYDKNNFTESGIIIYEGMQGSGKTISMVHDALLIKDRFPHCFLIDNLGMKGHDDFFNDPSQLCELNNGRFGICTLIDECGILFNNREYKHFNDTGMLQIIFENRKVRRCLMGTTQKFGLVDKNLRLQVSEVRSCGTIGGILTFYVRKQPFVAADGTIEKYRFKGIRFFVQSHELREAYDTFLVIKKFNDKGYKVNE